MQRPRAQVPSQTMPQPPQFFGSVCSFTLEPLQTLLLVDDADDADPDPDLDAADDVDPDPEPVSPPSGEEAMLPQ